MRISNSMVTDNFLRNLNNNLSDVIDSQEKVATGKRITRLSEDPVGVVSVMSSKMQIFRIEQYQKNINTTDDMLMQAESSVLELNELVKTSLTNTTQAANEFMSEDDKHAIGVLIGEFKEQAIAIGNASVSGRYIFGGFNTKNAPFETDAVSGELLYNGYELADSAAITASGELDNIIEYEIAENKNMKSTLLGTDIFGYGEDNLYNVLERLEEKLLTDASVEDISESIGELQDAQSRLLNVEAEIGGMTNRLQIMRTRYENEWLNNTEAKSEIEDVDYAEAYMEYSQANAVYTAALQISSKVLQNSLVDYLK